MSTISLCLGDKPFRAPCMASARSAASSVVFCQLRTSTQEMRRLQIRMRPLLDRPMPKTVARQVPDYGVEESCRIGLRLEALTVLPQAEEGLLHRITGILTRAEDARRIPDQARCLAVEQLPERRPVTRCDARRQRSRVALTRGHRTCSPARDRENASQDLSRDEPKRSVRHRATLTTSRRTVRARQQWYPETGYSATRLCDVASATTSNSSCAVEDRGVHADRSRSTCIPS